MILLICPKQKHNFYSYYFNNKLRLELVLVIVFLVLTTGLTQQDGVKSFQGSSDSFKPPLRANLTTDQGWIQSSLERHNYFRALHNSQKLVHNNTLSEISQAWSNYLLDRAIESFSRSRTVDFFEHNHPVLREHRLGENLFYTIAYYEKLNASIAVNLWYNEIKDYDFEFARVKSTSDPKSQIGHLTQLLWNSTTQMGTAYAAHRLPNGQTMTFVTANYYPRGNVLLQGKFPLKFYLENVLPPIAKAENEVEDRTARIHDKILYWEVPRANLTTAKSWIEAAVDKHNDFRGNFNYPEIYVNEQLCEVAQSWANTLLKQGVSDFNQNYLVKFYSSNFGATQKAKFGENMMYFIGDGFVDPTYPVKLWYQEKRFYNFDKRKTNETRSKTARTDHFEQVIWKDTSHMGIAFASEELESGQMLTFVVAYYYPSGQNRMFEERVENIPYENMQNYPEFQQVVIKDTISGVSNIFGSSWWSSSWLLALSILLCHITSNHFP